MLDPITVILDKISVNIPIDIWEHVSTAFRQYAFEKHSVHPPRWCLCERDTDGFANHILPNFNYRAHLAWDSASR